MRGARIASIEWGTLTGRRPRLAQRPQEGRPRLGRPTIPLARITTADGAEFGLSSLSRIRPSPTSACLWT